MQFCGNIGQRKSVFLRKSRSAGIWTHSRHLTVNADNIALAFLKLKIMPFCRKFFLGIFRSIKWEIIFCGKTQIYSAVTDCHMPATEMGAVFLGTDIILVHIPDIGSEIAHIGNRQSQKTIDRHLHADILQEQRNSIDTPEYFRAMRLRQIWCEGNFSHQKEQHNLRRTFKQGIEKVTEQCLLSACALNLKRLVKAMWVALFYCSDIEILQLSSSKWDVLLLKTRVCQQLRFGDPLNTWRDKTSRRTNNSRGRH